ncbi:MAG: carotenoid biosynthesis protein, partial [Verrucomicrobiota bacterium]
MSTIRRPFGHSPHPPSLLAQTLEPLAASLWVLFLLWSGLVTLVWCTHIGDFELKEWIANPGLRAALQAFIQALDPAWLTLAAVNVYMTLVHRYELGEARRWSLLVFCGALLLAWVSAATRFPLGPIHYTTRLGGQLGPVPFAWPFLWITVIFGAREITLRVLPHGGHNLIAAGTGLLACATALNLEPIAWKMRSWWFWLGPNAQTPGSPSFQYPLTWFVAATFFAWCMREPTVAIGTRRASWK